MFVNLRAPRSTRRFDPEPRRAVLRRRVPPHGRASLSILLAAGRHNKQKRIQSCLIIVRIEAGGANRGLKTGGALITVTNALITDTIRTVCISNDRSERANSYAQNSTESDEIDAGETILGGSRWQI